MKIIALILIFIIGCILSHEISKNSKTQFKKLLQSLIGKADLISHLESKIQKQINEALCAGRVQKHIAIDLKDLIVVDRSVVYTKRSIVTYYDTRSGDAFAMSGPESTLVISKTEIGSHDLQQLIASKSNISSFRESNQIDDQGKYKNVIPFRKPV